MRDIQDMTLAQARRGDELRNRLGTLMVHFANWFAQGLERLIDPVGFGIVAVPVSSYVNLGRVYGRFNPIQQERYFARIDNATQHTRLETGISPHNQRPILRGIRLTDDLDYTFLEVYSDGSIAFGFKTPTEQRCLYAGWLLGHLINVLRTADLLRTQAGMPDMEYAIDIEIRALTVGHPVKIGSFGNRSGAYPIGDLTTLPLSFPRMPFGPLAESDEFISQVFSDLCDATGYRQPNPVRITIDRSEQYWSKV